MPDLLVNLLKLPLVEPELTALQDASIIIRRARTFELSLVRSFIESNFSTAWADEVTAGFTRQPVTVFIATSERKIVGFAGYECTSRAFFGPAGVRKEFQHRRIGKALLLSSLWGLREMGYAYGIIGAAGPVEFYRKSVGAIVIPDSDPGIYTDLLRRDPTHE